MQRSESIVELAKALSHAQATIKGALKDTTNDFFNSRYADLASVMNVIKEPMEAAGLSILQMPINNDAGQMGLETMLIHSSGQFISNVFYMKSEKPGPQAAGSLITYMRRYALCAFLGVVQIDDDGNGATNHSAEDRKVPAINPRTNPTPVNHAPKAKEVSKTPQEALDKLSKHVAEKGIKERSDHEHKWYSSKFNKSEEYCGVKLNNGKLCGLIREKDVPDRSNEPIFESNGLREPKFNAKEDLPF